MDKKIKCLHVVLMICSFVAIASSFIIIKSGSIPLQIIGVIICLVSCFGIGCCVGSVLKGR